jgi:hypothetical protein
LTSLELALDTGAAVQRDGAIPGVTGQGWSIGREEALGLGRMAAMMFG